MAAEVCFRELDLDIMDKAHEISLNTDVLFKKGDDPLPKQKCTLLRLLSLIMCIFADSLHVSPSFRDGFYLCL